MTNAQPGTDSWDGLTAKQLDLYMKLTTLQKKVCRFLEAGLAPRDAYYAAGGTARNHRSADSTVWHLLNEPSVQAFRCAINEREFNHLIMTRAEMLTRLTAIARGNLADIARVKQVLVGYSDDGEPQYINRVEIADFDNAPEHSVQAVSEITQKEHGISLKMQSGLQAMKQLADLSGYEAPKVTEIKGIGGQVAIITGVSATEAASAYQELMR